jgi:hypothetical protein
MVLSKYAALEYARKLLDPYPCCYLVLGPKLASYLCGIE